MKYGYQVVDDRSEQRLVAPCGCDACAAAKRALPGHFACDAMPDELLAAEDRGELWRVYDGQWVWIVV